MESNTAAQRSSTVTTFSGPSLPASMRMPQPIRREAEYGCVDWYPYASTMPPRTEWFDYDNGLAVAGVG